MGAVEPVGDDDAKNGVAKKFEALVGWQSARFVSERAVRQRKDEQLGVDADTEPLHEGIGGCLPWSCDRSLPSYGLGLVLGAQRLDVLAAVVGTTRGARDVRSFWPCTGGTPPGRPAVVFHCERRARVLLRDILRLGTATANSLSFRSDPAGPTTWSRSPHARDRVIRESHAALVAQPGAIPATQRGERQASHHRVRRQLFEVDGVAVELIHVRRFSSSSSTLALGETNSPSNDGDIERRTSSKQRPHSPTACAETVP